MKSTSSRLGIIRCDRDWRIIAANPGAEGFLAEPPLVGRALPDLPFGRGLVTPGAHEFPYSRYVTYQSATGATQAFLANVASTDGRPFIAFEPAEWSLAMLTQLEAVVLAVDEHGQIVFMHHGDSRLPLYTPGDLVGRSIMDVSRHFIPAGGISPRQIAQIMAGKSDREHVTLREADGILYSINVRRIPWRYCGCSCGILVLVTDVTHISDAVAQDSSAVLFRIWHTLQHELRNPLQTMEAALELLRPHIALAGHRSLRVLNEQVEAMGAYLSDQLLVGLPPSGAMVRGRLSDVVSQEIERASLRLFTGQLRFEHRPIRDEPPVRLWEHAMGRVFANLFRNSAQALRDAQVDITYAESDGQVICRIMDDGPGFGAAILRTDWTRWPEPTQHLGLTLAASTLHAHGGRMVVSNHEGGGALVDICLPSAQSAATAVGQ